MGVTDFFKRRNFADGNSIRRRPQLDSEVGVSGATFIKDFNGEEATSDNITIDQYIKMRQNDGTVAALYNIITYPIQANGYSIVPHEDDTAGEVAKFVEDNFRLPPHRGGMSTPFFLFMADALRAILEGFRLFEKVWTLNDKGKIVYRKLAPRDARTVSLKRDETGGFDGAIQRAMYGGEYKDVTIPKERLFLWTFGKEKNFLYGESAFKPAFYHYDKKHKLYYLGNLGVEVGAVPPKVLKIKNSVSPDEKEKAESAVDKLGVRSRVTLTDDYELSPYEAAKGRIDPMPLIDHHNAEMARSFLAQFLMLGTGSETGSWALSKDQSEMFIIALQGIMNSLSYHITSYLIPELVDYNFGNGLYPEFKFEDMADTTKETLKEAFTKLLEKDSVPDWVALGIAKKVAEDLAIEEPENADETEKEDAEETPAEEETETSDRAKETQLEDRRWKRPLTPAEENVELAELQTKMNELEGEVLERVQPIFAQIKDDAIERLTKILESRDFQALETFELKHQNDYEKVLLQVMKGAYEYAKLGAADELKVSAPATKRETTALISQSVASIIEKHVAELLFIAKSEIMAELRKNTLAETELGVGDVLKRIAEGFQAFYEDKIRATATAIIAQAINRGRQDVFESSRNEIAVYQYSAILDGSTCPICEDLDGMIVDYAGYRSTQWEPPIHFNCRCIWVAIKADQAEIPSLTPIPTRPGGVTSPLLSDEHDITRRLKEVDEYLIELQEVRRDLASTKEKQKELDEKLQELEADGG